MHQALRIPELVDLTFSYIDTQPTTRKNRDALAKTARACRLWSAPALSRLWAEQKDLWGILEFLSPIDQKRKLFNVGVAHMLVFESVSRL